MVVLIVFLVVIEVVLSGSFNSFFSSDRSDFEW